MSNKKPFGAMLGDLLAKIIVACLFLCLAAVVVTLTAKFIGWMIF